MLVRSLKYEYLVEGVVAVNIKETKNVKKDFTVDQLLEESKKFMKTRFGVDNATRLEIPIKIKKEIYIK